MGTKVIPDPSQGPLAEVQAGKTDRWSELAMALTAEIRRRFDVVAKAQ